MFARQIAHALGETFPPAASRPLVAFRVDGVPKPAGSKAPIPLGKWVTEGGKRRFVPFTRESGVPVVNVKDSSGEAGDNWRTDVRAACVAALDMAHELADGPLIVRVVFFGASPQARYGTGRNAGVLKNGADAFPHRSALADGTKLTRALEDALTAVLWTDDRRVVDCWWSRRFGRPGAEVTVWTLPQTFAELRAARRGSGGYPVDHDGSSESQITLGV